MCRWRHKIRKIAVEILQSVNNRTQCLLEIAYYAWFLLTYIVINTLLGRVTLDPAGKHCPWWDDAFVSSLFVCWSRSESGTPCVRGVHSSNTHCVAIYRPISTRFEAIFFGRDFAFRHATQFSHSSLGGATIFAKLRSTIAKSPNIGGKDCAHHFVEIAEVFEKNSIPVV